MVLQRPPISEARDDFGNKITEYPKTTLYVQTTERDKVGGLLDPMFDNNIDYTGTDIWLQKRRSRIVSLETNITLNIKVSDNTTLQNWRLDWYNSKEPNGCDYNTRPLFHWTISNYKSKTRILKGWW